MTNQSISIFQNNLRGRVVQPADADYDAARALYNGMIDKRPRLIARCVDVADVITAVNFGREQGLLIAIRGGGHNGPGLGSCDDGLVVDLSMMKSVRVDPDTRTVRVDAGCTSGDVDHATHAFGLAVPFGIVSTTGVAGLTLGGGTGYLTRKYAMPFPAIQRLFDPFFPKGLEWYWKGDFVRSLPDAAIDAHIEQAAKAPTELSLMHLYPIDGAVHRMARDATAWSARDTRWSMVIAGISADPNQAEALKAWGRACWKSVHPFNLEGAYVNFMMDDEAEGRLEAAYGENYQRLVLAKAKYDPHNLFRVNQNIQPAIV